MGHDLEWRHQNECWKSKNGISASKSKEFSLPQEESWLILKATTERHLIKKVFSQRPQQSTRVYMLAWGSRALWHPLRLCFLWTTLTEPADKTHYTQNTLAPSQVCHWSAFGSVCGLKPRIMLLTCWSGWSGANHVCTNSFSSGVPLSLCHH